MLPPGTVDHARTVVARDPETGLRLRPPLVGVARPARLGRRPRLRGPVRRSCCPSTTPSSSTSARPTPPSATASWRACGGLDRLCAVRTRPRPRSRPIGRSCASKVAVVTEESREVPGNLAMETGELPPIQRDPSKPLKRPRFRPMRLTIKVVLFVAAIYIFVLPLIPDFQDAVHEITRVEPRVPRRRVLAAVRGVVRLLAADPVGARRVGPPGLALAHVPDPDEHQGALEHRARRQRRRLGARLPAAHAVGRPRRRRRLRPGDGRARLGRRPQPHLLDRAAGVDPAPRRQPAVRHGRAARARRSCSSSPCSWSACSTARAAPRRSCTGSGASCASIRTPPPAPCARSASAWRS